LNIRFLAYGVVILWTMFLAQAGAMAKENRLSNMPPCMAIIKSSADAAEKADWIVEANLDDGMVPSTDQNQLFLTISDMEEVKGGWPGKRGATGSVLVGQCFPGGKVAFEGPAGKRLFGQRLRLFGSKHLDDPRRRVFYIEPVSVKMAAMRPSSPVSLETKMHRQDATNPLPGGWHRAHSTGGEFSIDMPAPFQDVTAATSGKAGQMAGFMLRTTDANGITFFAVREPNGPDPSMAGSFDTEMKSKRNKIVQFKGVSAVETSTTQGAVIMHSLMFRVPGGTYMLGVSAPKERDKESTLVRERFYQSLAFD
jgi:hypothetical protein